MSKFLIFTGILLLSGICHGQRYIKPFVGASFSNRMLTSGFSARKDSLDQADKMKISPTAGIHFLFEKKPGREFYFGFAYFETGFVRERLNYKFQDTVHPDLGRILDLSQGAEKNGFFTYHFKYIEIPLGFNFQITPRQNMNIYTGWFNIGLTPQILMHQNMTIFLQGFSMKGKNRFDFANTGYTAAKFNLALQSGGRIDFVINKKNWVTVDAFFKMHLLNTAESPHEKLRAWSFLVNLGIRREIGDIK